MNVKSVGFCLSSRLLFACTLILLVLVLIAPLGCSTAPAPAPATPPAPPVTTPALTPATPVPLTALAPAPTPVTPATPAKPDNPALIMASTTSTRDSGLMDVLIPLFDLNSGQHKRRFRLRNKRYIQD